MAITMSTGGRDPLSDHFQESPQRSWDSLTLFQDPPSSISRNNPEPTQLCWAWLGPTPCCRKTELSAGELLHASQSDHCVSSCRGSPVIQRSSQAEPCTLICPLANFFISSYWNGQTHTTSVLINSNLSDSSLAKPNWALAGRFWLNPFLPPPLMVDYSAL